MKDTDTKKRFIELRAKGLSYDKISGELGVSKPTLIKWCAELSKEVSEAKILELDALLEQFELAKAQRVKAFAKLLKKVNEELVQRDFSKVRTEKLLEMALALDKKLVEEIQSISCDFKFGGQFDIADLYAVKEAKVTALD